MAVRSTASGGRYRSPHFAPILSHSFDDAIRWEPASDRGEVTRALEETENAKLDLCPRLNCFRKGSDGFQRENTQRVTWGSYDMGNCIGLDTPPPGAPSMAAAGDESVILVVGNNAVCKTRVANALARGRCTTETKETKAGTRFHNRNLFLSQPETSEPVVIDSTNLETVSDWGRINTSRIWVSRNSLRRLFGKQVFVVAVCVVDHDEDNIFLETDRTHKKFSWLHLLTCIFEANKRDITFLVDCKEDEGFRDRIRGVLRREGLWTHNIWFFNLRRGDLMSELRSLVQRSISGGKPGAEETLGFAKPFQLQEVNFRANDRLKYGPWGPENVILFGKSGSGKSTLAQMLTLGRLDPRSKNFFASSSVRGATGAIRNGYGRGWRVVDTPGLGEPNSDCKSTINTDKAGRLLREYLMIVDGTYCHFLYVWKKGKLEVIDNSLWTLFKKMFGEEMISKHVTVVVSDADQSWLERNIEDLQMTFEGCDNFVSAEFPATYKDEEEENYAQQLREDSLRAFEDELASLCRLDESCRLGKWSIGTQRCEYTRVEDPSVYTMRPAIYGGGDYGSSLPHPTDYQDKRSEIWWRNFCHSLPPRHEKLELLSPSRSY